MNSQLLKKTTGAHYTSVDLSKFMAQKLLYYFEKEMGYTIGEKYTILDPSCGEGELLYAINELFLEKGISHTVLGTDTNEEAINIAKKRFNAESKFIVEDYLESLNYSSTDLFSDFEEKLLPEEVDLVIANPPYVRTQVMGEEKSKALSEKFELKGKVDLYQAFLVAMTQQLKKGGLICVITSNKYLTNATGKDTRKFLNNNYDILEIIDLGDTKLFSAAILPAIFIGRKKTSKNKIGNLNNNVKFTRIYEHTSEKESTCNIEKTSIFDILNTNKSGVYKVIEGKNYDLKLGTLSVPENPKDLWVMASEEDKAWANKLKKNAAYTFKDLFKVRVGIKTTADKVFIHKKEFWDNLTVDIKPESDVLFPLISSDNITKWNLNRSLVEQTKILYTHCYIDGKKQAINLKKYPRTEKYLLSNEKILAARKYIQNTKSRNWYEIWVPQDPKAFKETKVVFPDISLEPKFTIDNNKYLIDGNCYWLTKLDGIEEDYLYLACAVGNSKIMKRFHEIEFQNVLYAGRKRYLTQYVEKYLIPNINSSESREIIEIVKQLANGANNVNELENRIDNLLYKAFDIE